MESMCPQQRTTSPRLFSKWQPGKKLSPITAKQYTKRCSHLNDACICMHLGLFFKLQAKVEKK